jgi:CheY-like chemotaxis protein
MHYAAIGINEQAFLLETSMSPSTISSPLLELFTVGYRPAAVHTDLCQGEHPLFAWRILACFSSDSNPSGSVIRIKGVPLASRKTGHRLSDELTAKFVGGLFDKE